MKILVLGSGGREHAFTWKIAQSPLCSKLYVANGNAGTAQIAENVAISPTDFPKIEQFVLQNRIDMVVVGSEAPLVEGIADYFYEREELRSIKLIAPSQRGAMLEGSKDFSKRFMQKYGIPAAKSETFTADKIEDGVRYLRTFRLPIVLKADGLAAGKGVIIAQTYEEAEESLRNMLIYRQFGEASQKVLIEEFLDGIEVSVFVLTDGKSYKILPEAKDYKRIGENDQGLNTGGMGAVSPVPFANEAFMKQVEETIVKPTLKGLQMENIAYKGFIFVGIMNVGGVPYVLEYNVRMGDPETEVVMPRITSDLVKIFDHVATGTLADAELTVSNQCATTVMVVSGGYPESYENGKEMTGFETVGNDVITFHAGTKLQDGKIYTNGGRVITFTGMGNTIPEALEKSVKAAHAIQFDKKYFRKDIGLDLLK